jgi:RNA polymerase sigma factor (sigma-70 family)
LKGDYPSGTFDANPFVGFKALACYRTDLAMSTDRSSPNVDDHVREFRELLDRIRGGSEEAAWELVERYERSIMRAVRQLLGFPLRAKVDSADFAQDVWLSFFRHRSAIVELEHPFQLIQFLATTTAHKVIDEQRKRRTARHDVFRERSLDAKAAVGTSLVSTDPTPSQFAIARERWDRILAGHPDHYRQVLRMRYLGCDQAEIADTLGIHERTVRKILKKLDVA